MLAVEREMVALVGSHDDVHRLVEHFAVDRVGICFVGIVEAADEGAERLRLARHGASSYAQHASSAGEVVHGGEVFGEAQGVPLGDDVEERADAQSGGALCQHRGEEHPVGHHLVAFVLEVVLGEPENVEAGLFGLHPHVQHSRGGVPHLFLGVAAVGGDGRPRPGIVHLHPSEKEHAGFNLAHLNLLLVGLSLCLRFCLKARSRRASHVRFKVRSVGRHFHIGAA